MNRNITIRSASKKIFMAVLVQAVVLGFSVITGFILPMKMGPEQFGYWQIYAFYLAYLNLFGMGFNDGFALFYGGYDYQKLPFGRIRSAMRIFYGYLFVITATLFFIFFLINSFIHRQIYQTLAINIPSLCLQYVVMTVFLSVNRTGVYNSINLLSRIISTGFYLALIYSGATSASQMMTVDLCSKVIISIICLIIGRQFLFGKADSFKSGIYEFGEKSKSGINITMAIIASMFIPVAGRLIIEWNEPIAVYGMYSFAMMLLALILAFTSTAGQVIFPLLKRIKTEMLSVYYANFSIICDALIHICLLLYILLYIMINKFMTNYISILGYIHILLAMCLPLGRMQLLIIPYYKAMRLEKAFLVLNVLGVIAMILFTALIYSIFQSVTAVAACSTTVLTLWEYGTEKYLSKRMGVRHSMHNFFVRLLMMTGFIIAGSFKNAVSFALIYLGFLIVYFAYYRKFLYEVFALGLKNK